MKQCNACGNTKPFPEFSKRKASKDGYAHKCKSCSNLLSNCYHQEKHKADPKYRARKLFNVCKMNAKARRLEFELDLDWVEEKINAGFCDLTKLPFVFEYTGKAKRNPFAPSIDRIDNSQGYTKHNARVVLWGVNQALNEYGLETMMPIFNAIVNNGK